MALNFIHNLGPVKSLILAAWRWDALNKKKRFEQVLNPNSHILDIGAGYGMVTQAMTADGHRTLAVDVSNQSVLPSTRPVIYNGRELPFMDQVFDYGLLLTVLHHTPEPEQVLAEAARVCQSVIVIEDVYRNPFQKRLTHFFDSLFNFEFKGHPHTNKDRKGWQQACEKLGLSLKVIKSDRFLLFFRQETYLIQKAAL